MFQTFKNFKKDNEDKYVFEIEKLLNVLKNDTSIYGREDEIVVILLCTFVILKKNKIIKSLQKYCQETRMTSVPTFSKLYKEYNGILSS